jgi:methanogenic corrinoid protein MtbC1
VFSFRAQVFKHYFEELEEESLRDNFVVVVRGAFLRCT